MRENQYVMLLGQATPTATDGTSKPAETPSIWPLLLAFAAIFYFVVYLPEKRKSQGQKGMLDGLKKNDRVQTIGGIIGVVTNVQRDVDRVTLRVDEATGATIKVTISAISRVLAEEPAPSSN